ncbi:MAG: hypothetical protein KDB23_06565 [Planctomycetales bacterium]|nr:hypothetical protein [Planctomycetales bacterium]
MDQAESLRRWVIEMAPAHDATVKQGAVVLVAAATPGVGATTVARQLALTWARRQQLTAWIDASRRSDVDADKAIGDATSDCRSERGKLADVLEQRRTLREAWTTGPCGVAVLGARARGEAEAGTRCERFDADHPFVEQLAQAARQYRILIQLTDLREIMAVLPVVDHCVFVSQEQDDSLKEIYRLIKQTSHQLRGGQCWSVLNQVTDPALARQSHRRLMATCDRHLNLAVHAAGTLPWDASLGRHGTDAAAWTLGLESSGFRFAFERFTAQLESAFATSLRGALKEIAV